MFLLSLIPLSQLRAGHYAKDVFPVVRKKHPDVIVSSNNYMISIEEKKIARAALGPQIELSGEATYSQSKVENLETKFDTNLGAYLTFEQPIYDAQRLYGYARGKKNELISRMQNALSDQTFIMVFAEGLLRISGAKSRYFFARQNLEYFKSYFEKEKKREEAAFLATHPGQDFKWIKSLTLLTIDQEVRAFERNVDVLHNAYMSERIAFETTILQDELKTFIMVNPFLRRPNLVMTEKAAVNYVAMYNPSVQIANQGVQLADINVKEAKRLRWPRLSLFARTGISTHGNDEGESRIRDDMIGIGFSIPLGGQGIRNKQRIAGFEKVNSEQNVIKVQMDVVKEARQLHNRIAVAKKNIDSLIESFEASKKMIQIFLADDRDAAAFAAEDQLVAPATNADRKRIMDTHFATTRDLAIEQHTYLTSLLRLYYLLGNLDMKQLGEVEDRFFVKCEDYEKFIALANKPGVSPGAIPAAR